MGMACKSTMSGASPSSDLMKRVGRFANNDQAVMANGIEWATKRCQGLLTGGAPVLHF